MRILKNTNVGKYKTVCLPLNTFDKNPNFDISPYVLEDGYPRICYNLVYKNGALVEGNGFRYLRLPFTQERSAFCSRLPHYTKLNCGYIKMWDYRYFSSVSNRYEYYLIFYMADKKLYYINLYTNDLDFTCLGDFTFETTPNVINFKVDNKDVIGFCEPNGNLVVWYGDEPAYTVENTPKFVSICYHDGRLFAIDSNRSTFVRYSSVINPLNWSASIHPEDDGESDEGEDNSESSSSSLQEAGYIDLSECPGENKLVVSYGGNVYVFREYGITKISTLSSKFIATNIYSSTARIYCNTVCFCGEELYFCQDNGLFKFDGYTIEQVKLELLNAYMPSYQEAINTCYFEGKLFISCRLIFNDFLDNRDEKWYNNCVIIYDIGLKTYSLFRDLDIIAMHPINVLRLSKLALIQKDDLSHRGVNVWEWCNRDNSVMKLYQKWQTGKITLGDITKTKTLKEIHVVAKTNMTTTIKTESKSKTFSITGKNEKQIIKINMLGKEFEISFDNYNSNFYLEPPELIFLVKN